MNNSEYIRSRDIVALRNRLGEWLPVRECRHALQMSNGTVDDAVRWLVARGIAVELSLRDGALFSCIVPKRFGRIVAKAEDLLRLNPVVLDTRLEMILPEARSGRQTSFPVSSSSASGGYSKSRPFRGTGIMELFALVRSFHFQFKTEEREGLPGGACLIRMEFIDTLSGKPVILYSRQEEPETGFNPNYA